MEKSNAIQILKSRTLIAKPGKYRVKTTSATSFYKDLGNGISQVAIANFDAMTSYHLEAAKTLFAQGDYQEACNQKLSASIRSNDYNPSKGEIVDIVVDEVTTKNGITGLFIVSISPVKAETASKVNMDAFLSDSEPRAEVSFEESKEEAKSFAKKA